MSGDFANTDIILLALVAGFVLLRLRSLLGQQPELPPPATQTPARPKAGTEEAKPAAPPPEEDETPFLANNAATTLPARLKELRKIDPSFRARGFLDGAKGAFEMVLDAFDKSDRKALKNLLDNTLFETFMQEIKQRKAQDTRQETTLIAIKSAEIVDAEVRGNAMQVTVRFVSEQVHLVRNPAGEIVEGDPSAIEEITDVWTFERDARSHDPNWKLVATQA